MSNNIQESPGNLSHLKPVYLALHISGGQVGLPLIVATLLLSKKVTKHPTLINFFCTWIIHSVVFCILLYSGQRHQPSDALCQIQSALIHGAPPMSVVSTLAIVIQLWSTLREPQIQQHASSSSSKSRWPRTLRLKIMLALPYAVFTFFVTLTALLQRRPGITIGSWNGLYCTVRGDPIVQYAVPSFCTAMLVAIVGFEVAIAVRYFHMQRTISDSFPLADTRRASPAMVLRIFAFSAYTLVTLSAGVLFLTRSRIPWPYMVQAALPLSALLIFGTQKDIILVWRFWKPYPAIPPFDTPPKHTVPVTRPLSVDSIDALSFWGMERIPTTSASNV